MDLSLLQIFQLISGTLSFLLFLVIGVILKKHSELSAEDKINYKPDPGLVEPKVDLNADWERVLKYYRSNNPSDWKLAIMEADNMLDALTKDMGFPGESLGERLKSIEPSDFDSLQEAWDAPKVRNAIAHQSGFVLTQREVQAVLAKFEKVFKEFSYI
jgi:hypothetical protein